MKILIVDDETEQIVSLKVGLKSKGFKVIEALNAADALKHLNNNGNKIDVVLTDYGMPGMDGMELVKKIRKKHNTLPVIMMTAYGEKDLVINALRNRCNGFIDKPFSLDQLIKEIEMVRINADKNTDSHQLPEIISELVHQINNPLMCITGSAELGMIEFDNNRAMKDCLTKIMEATEKIKKINGKLLKRGRTAKEKIRMVNIGEILDDCLIMFKDLLAFKCISLEKRFYGDHPDVLGNRFGLEQMFKNLILNAIDSMDGRSEKRLKIKVETDKAASSVLVSIKDTGCGIPEESLKKIFTPYFTGKEENGTGLGLPVVKDVLEKHNGRIFLESQEGKGTTFTVRLPVDRPGAT